MIIGAHVIVYSTAAEADRAFLLELLGTRHVDAGGGWLIAALPPAEIAVHPTDPCVGPASDDPQPQWPPESFPQSRHVLSPVESLRVSLQPESVARREFAFAPAHAVSKTLLTIRPDRSLIRTCLSR